MGVTYQNKTESETAGGTSLTLTAPSGFSAGDLFIACVCHDSDQVTSHPSGWTVIQDQVSSTHVRFSVLYRIAEVGDTSWIWTVSGLDEGWVGCILRYTGQATSGFIHASNNAAGLTTTPIAPSVSYTSLHSGSLALQCFGADDNDIPYTTPSPLAEKFNDSVSTGWGDCGHAGGDKVASGSGSTGTAEFTMNASEQWVAITIVIAAAEVSGNEYYDTVTKVIVATPTKTIGFKRTLSVSETSILTKSIEFQRTLSTSGTMTPTKLFKFLNTFNVSGTHSPSISPLFGVTKSFTSSMAPTLSDVALYHLTQSIQASIVPLTLLKLFITKALTTSEVPTVSDIYILASLVSTTIDSVSGVECKFKLSLSTSGTITPDITLVSGKYDTVSFSIQTTPTLSRVLNYTPTVTLDITIESFIEALQVLVSEESFSGTNTLTIDMKDLIEVFFTETSNFTSFLKFFLSESLSQTNTPTVGKALSYKKTLDTSITSSLTIDKILDIVSSLSLSTTQNTEALSKFILELSSTITGTSSTNLKFLLNVLFTEQSVFTKSLKFILIKLLTGTFESTVDITIAYKDSVSLTLSEIPSATLEEFVSKLILLLEDSKIEDIILSDTQLKELILTDAKTKGLTLEDA
jgi:hypothetical protein